MTERIVDRGTYRNRQYIIVLHHTELSGIPVFDDAINIPDYYTYYVETLPQDRLGISAEDAEDAFGWIAEITFDSDDTDAYRMLSLGMNAHHWYGFDTLHIGMEHMPLTAVQTTCKQLIDKIINANQED